MATQTRHLLPLGCSSSEHLPQLLINTVTFSISGFHCGRESEQTAAVVCSFQPGKQSFTNKIPFIS